MKKMTYFLMMAIIACSLTACAGKAKQEELKIEKSAVARVSATVEAVDMASRMMTIRNQEGKLTSFQVSDAVVNFPQVKVGDKIVLEYAEALAVRMAKPGEVQDSTGSLLGKAAPGNKPGVVGATEKTMTATIESINKPSRTATLTFADGTMKIVKVADPANLDKVKVGDVIVITYSEAMALSVQTAQ